MHKASLLALAALILAAPAAAQEAPPTGLAAQEEERSRACVGILARLDTLDADLAPLAARSQRLLLIRQAIQLEERGVVDSLRTDDPTEAAVRDWFASDLELAQRYVESRDEALVTQRSAGRRAILEQVEEAIQDTRTEAQEHIAAAGDLTSVVGACEGAILVRPVVLEACGSATSRLCTAAAQPPSPGQPYRFVDTAEDLWGVSEFRPWTEPGPLQIGPDGQLTGARTVAYARQGNVVLTSTFSPLLQQRADLPPEQVGRMDAIVDSLDFDFSHPEIAMVPALGFRTLLPQPLAGETEYVLHFGSPDSAVALWSGPSGTGAATEVTVAMGPAYAMALASGAPLSFTAVREAEEGTAETVFSVQFTPVNQGPAVSALLGYMSEQLSTDLAALLAQGGGG